MTTIQGSTVRTKQRIFCEHFINLDRNLFAAEYSILTAFYVVIMQQVLVYENSQISHFIIKFNFSARKKNRKGRIIIN